MDQRVPVGGGDTAFILELVEFCLVGRIFNPSGRIENPSYEDGGGGSRIASLDRAGPGEKGQMLPSGCPGRGVRGAEEWLGVGVVFAGPENDGGVVPTVERLGEKIFRKGEEP